METEDTVYGIIRDYLKEAGLKKRELYYYPEDVESMPGNKVMRITLELVDKDEVNGRTTVS